MKPALVAASAAVGLAALTGCGGSGSSAGTTTAATTATTPTAQAVFSLDEIGLGPEGYVTLRNFTDVPQSLAGLVVCQGGDCDKLPAVDVQPAKRVRVAVGDGKGVAGVVVKDAHIGDLKPSDGEIAVYAAGDASSPQELVSYLQWGSTPHPRTAAAVKAGLWPRTAYAPTAPNAVRLYRRPGGLWLFATAKSPDGK